MAGPVQEAEGGAAASDKSATATTIEDLHPDVLSRALCLLDGPALAAASCATSRLRSLAAHPDIWRDLCLATWPSLRSHPRLLHLLIPSFPHAHRSFFSDAFPSPFCSLHSVAVAAADAEKETFLPSELISAVDLWHREVPIFSRVVETDASSPWFQGSPFRIDALDRKHHYPQSPQLAGSAEPSMSPEDLTLSWVLVDPASRRAVNVSSWRPVALERHWFTGEVVVRFATVLGAGFASVGAVVTCGKETGHVRSVSLTAESMDGVCLSGKDSLVVLAAAMRGGRRRWEGEAEARRRWEEFVGLRRRRKEVAAAREGAVDLVCAAFATAVFVAFVILVLIKLI